MAYVVNSFLGCFKLRTGCFIIGYLGAIGSFFAVVCSIIGIVFTALRESFLKGDELYINNILMWTFSILLVTCSICYALYVVLLIGLHQDRPKLLKAYLIYMTIYLVIIFIIVLLMTLFWNIFLGLRCLLTFVCNVYYMLVIRSYYFKMKESTDLKTGTKPV